MGQDMFVLFFFLGTEKTGEPHNSWHLSAVLECWFSPRCVPKIPSIISPTCSCRHRPAPDLKRSSPPSRICRTALSIKPWGRISRGHAKSLLVPQRNSRIPHSSSSVFVAWSLCSLSPNVYCLLVFINLPRNTHSQDSY